MVATATTLSQMPRAAMETMAAEAWATAKELALERQRFRTREWRGQAKQLFECQDPEVIISGPAGTGKSTACLYHMHMLAMNYPRFRGLLVRLTRNSLTTTGLVTMDEQVLGLDHPLVVNSSQRRYRSSYNYANGSVIEIGGLDKPSKILSSEYDVIFVQQVEELTEDAWETLMTRLRNYRMPYQQMLGDCNPDHPEHWIRQRANAGGLTLLSSYHEDNPLLYDASKKDWTGIGRDYLKKLDALTGVRYRRLRKGEWAAVEGAIYEEWDRGTHLIQPIHIPRDWQRYRSIDFGFTHPAVIQWWAEDKDGRLYMYREYYHTGKTVKDLAQIIKQAEGWYKTDNGGKIKLDANGEPVPNPYREQVFITICDWDAGDRATLEAEGIATIAADKRIKVGIEAVQHRLRKAEDGKPRLFIFANALMHPDPSLVDKKKPINTVQEIPNYVWRDHASKEEPIGRDDHGADAMRYMVLHLDQPGSFGFADVNIVDRRPLVARTSTGRRDWLMGNQLPRGNRWRLE